MALAFMMIIEGREEHDDVASRLQNIIGVILLAANVLIIRTLVKVVREGGGQARGSREGGAAQGNGGNGGADASAGTDINARSTGSDASSDGAAQSSAAEDNASGAGGRAGTVPPRAFRAYLVY